MMKKYLILSLLFIPSVYADDITYYIDKNLISVTKDNYNVTYTPYKNKIRNSDVQKILQHNDCIDNIDLRLIAPKLIQEINNKNIKIFDVETFIDKEIEKELNNCKKILLNTI